LDVRNFWIVSRVTTDKIMGVSCIRRAMPVVALNAFLPHLGELTPVVVERWITAALAFARALHAHDELLYPG
jgi:hypothetical protein